jgi:hypothetical protein
MHRERSTKDDTDGARVRDLARFSLPNVGARASARLARCSLTQLSLLNERRRMP